jgi:hypothetical protein
MFRGTQGPSGASNCNCSVRRVGCGEARKIAARKIEMEKAKGFGIVRDSQVGEFDFTTAGDSSGADQNNVAMKGKVVNITLESLIEDYFGADIRPR